MNKTQALYELAKKRIPLGSNLWSKRPEIYAPNQYPAYYKKAKGVYVTDLDDREYLDMSTMGIGACVLGYADPDVDDAVVRAIQSGSAASLNPACEVELAGVLLTLHPWAEMVRYTRSGGEAMSVAIRIAQAATGREQIHYMPHAYHGWHVNNPITQEQFIPCSMDMSRVAAIIVQVDRAGIEAIKHARFLADQSGAVLVFDEISAGFRNTCGGLHLKYKINPDIAVFSKAISNGYPFGAVIGTEKVMSAVQNTFISSTTWSERIGPTAALASIMKFWSNDVHEHITRLGNMVQQKLNTAEEKYGIPIEVGGISPLTHYKFANKALDTLYVQLMLDRNILTGTQFYPSYAHNFGHVDRFFDALDEVLPYMSMHKDHPETLLKGPVAETGIKR